MYCNSSSHVAFALLAGITLARSATLNRRDCSSFTQDSIFTTTGDQVAITTDNRCEDSSGCMLPVEHTVVAASSWNGNSSQSLLETITDSTGMEFEESRNYTLTQRFNQQAGNGYLTFIPTLQCINGTVNDCEEDGGNSEGDEVWACKPQYNAKGDEFLPAGQYWWVERS